MLIVLIITIIILIIIILLLPLKLAIRINLIIVTVGVSLTAYTLFRAIRNENRIALNTLKDDNDRYYTDIYKLFAQDKELEKMYYQIYGYNNVSPKEFAMFSVMIEAIQNVAVSHNYESIPTHWYNIWYKWISHQDFIQFWSMAHNEFSTETTNLINQLLNRNI